MPSYKPSGYNSVSPYFIVEDTPRFVVFLRQVFGAQELRTYAMPDGTIMHMEMQIEDSVVMLGSSSEKFPAIQQLVHIYVPDVDAIFRRAILAGCISLGDPGTREGDPDKRGTFKDFAGNVWSVSTQMD